ncbi:MAG: hypothetical protein RLZZ46_1363 [Bacteroidota bacterium]|jgi:hypothetical protein
MFVRRLIVISWLVILAPSSIMAQKLLFSITVNDDSLIADPLGNSYLMKSAQLVKYDANGKLLMRYSNKVLGEIASADASNPMKILLFYPNQNRIVFLDNQLSENGPAVDLSQGGFDQSLLACTSHDNGIWIFDQREFELVRLDQDLRVSHRSGNIPLQTGLPLKPIYLFQYQNFVFLYDPLIGFLTFDIFGTYIKTIPILNATSISFSDGCIHYLKDEKLLCFQLLSLQEKEIPLPIAGATQAIVLKEKIQIKTPEKIWVFSRD